MESKYVSKNVDSLTMSLSSEHSNNRKVENRKTLLGYRDSIAVMNSVSSLTFIFVMLKALAVKDLMK